jgi:hypothetical protein
LCYSDKYASFLYVYQRERRRKGRRERVGFEQDKVGEEKERRREGERERMRMNSGEVQNSKCFFFF